MGLLLFPLLSFSQNFCGQFTAESSLVAQNPALIQRLDSFQHQVSMMQYAGADRADKKIIPVVFHIIHMNGPENISDAQVYDAMRVINESYSATNADISEVVAGFVNVVGTGDIEFRLATKDPSGQATNGIDRIVSSETYIGDDGSKLNPWPRSKYLNIWVTDAIYISGAAAYAYKPAAASDMASVDGIISNHRYVGTIGTANAGFGTYTLTHEIGHYLGLSHTWSSASGGVGSGEPGLASNCNEDDGVSDTPNCIGVANGSCNLSQVTCGSLDNIQNYMDYASCDVMFTQGQVNVMRAVLASSLAQRSSLVTNANLIATGVNILTAAKFYLPKRILCRGESVQLLDQSTYDADAWNWTLSGPISLTSTDQNPTFEFLTPGLYTVSLTAKQGSTIKTTSETNAILVADYISEAVPFTEDFNSGNDRWITYNHGEESTSNTWKYSTTVGNGDNFSFKMSTLGQESNRLDDLMFGGVDFRPLTSVTISFDVAYAQISSTDYDKLQCELSPDCGETWNQIWAASGSTLAGTNGLSTSAYIPSSTSDWKTNSISGLPASWVSENTFIRFRFTSGGGNNLYLDNIYISGTFNTVPMLVYPSNNAPAMNQDVKLDWRSIPNVDSYEYELDETAAFNGGSKISGTKTYIDEASSNEDTEFATSDLVTGKQYFWRVRALIGSVASGWSETRSFTVANDGVGVSDLDKSSYVKIYPNPASDLLTIETQSPIQQIELLSINGQVLVRANVNLENGAEISLDNLSPGSYFIKIVSTAGNTFHHFVVSE